MSYNMLDVWTRVLELMENEVTQIGFSTWIKDIVPVSVSGNVFYLNVDNNITQNMVSTRYSALIKNCLFEVTGENFEIAVSVASKEPKIKEAVERKSQRYTFDNFIIGTSNRFAHAGALAVAESPAIAYNPLFLYGDVGLGKTHLMNAIKNYIKADDPEKNIVFVSGESFTNEFVESIMSNSVSAFRNKFRSCDVLLVDDIQFIAGKERSEEEFFYTFEALHQSERQIVISSDRPPNEIQMVHNRLLSRFEWGLTCDLHPPDFETRMAIIKQKLEDENEFLEEEIVELIATKVKNNIRELEGVYNRVIAYKRLIDGEISPEVVNNVIEQYVLDDKNKKPITVKSIIEFCAKFFGVTPEDIISTKRTKEIAFARKVAIYVSREITGLSSPKIGTFFNRDHATVIYNCEALENEMKEDLTLKGNVSNIIKDIKEE